MSLIQRFRKDESGNFALIFGLTLLPISLAIGAAVDYSRVSSDKSVTQDRLDTAVLAGAIALRSKSETEVKQLIIDEFRAYLPRDLANNINDIVVNVDKDSGLVTADVDSYTNATIMAIAGYDKIDYTTNASVKMKIEALEIALVLDNTGSMEVDNKLDSLKNSASSFVDSLFENASDGKVKVGIVPFAKYVNVGTSNRNASWMNVEDDYTKTGTRTYKPVLSKTNCRTETYYADGVPKTYEKCDKTYGPEVTEPYTKDYSWYGCVGSRPEPMNLKDGDYTGRNRVPGLVMTWQECPNEIQTLTNIKSELLDQIDDMRAKGDTYIPSGVVWGTKVLSTMAPFTQASEIGASDESQKIMILMTDGDNSVSAELPDEFTHNNSDADQANDWTEQACENAKAAGITMYTITFGEGIEDDTKELMVGCASSESNYFDAANADKLNDAFKGILEKLSRLHLSS